MQLIQPMSPRALARTAGGFDFLEGLTSSAGQVFVPGMLVVSGDAAATATNILNHELLFRLSVTAALIGVACHIAWTLLFYELFKPVNRIIALLAAFVSLVAIALQAASTLLQLAPLTLLQGGGSLGAFTGEQLQALTLMFLNLRTEAFDTYLVFFGFWCVLTGYLIFNSTFMPRMIGVLEVVSGLCWLTFLWPPLAKSVFGFIAALDAPGELSVLVWLLVFGVNAQRWNEQASAARISSPGSSTLRPEHSHASLRGRDRAAGG